MTGNDIEKPLLCILLPKEAAALLKIPKGKLGALTREGKIPGCAKLGNEWRYSKEGIASLFLAKK